MFNDWLRWRNMIWGGTHGGHTVRPLTSRPTPPRPPVHVRLSRQAPKTNQITFPLITHRFTTISYIYFTITTSCEPTEITMNLVQKPRVRVFPLPFSRCFGIPGNRTVFVKALAQIVQSRDLAETLDGDPSAEDEEEEHHRRENAWRGGKGEGRKRDETYGQRCILVTRMRRALERVERSVVESVLERTIWWHTFFSLVNSEDIENAKSVQKTFGRLIDLFVVTWELGSIWAWWRAKTFQILTDARRTEIAGYSLIESSSTQLKNPCKPSRPRVALIA